LSCETRVARFIFSKKAKPPLKKGQKRAKPFTLQSQIYQDLPPHNSNSHKNTSGVLTAHPQKAINLKLFLELVTYDRKMPKFFSFSNTPKQNYLKNQ